jgi:hypothetical protein
VVAHLLTLLELTAGAARERWRQRRRLCKERMGGVPFFREWSEGEGSCSRLKAVRSDTCMVLKGYGSKVFQPPSCQIPF